MCFERQCEAILPPDEELSNCRNERNLLWDGGGGNRWTIPIPRAQGDQISGLYIVSLEGRKKKKTPCVHPVRSIDQIWLLKEKPGVPTPKARARIQKPSQVTIFYREKENKATRQEMHGQMPRPVVAYVDSGLGGFCMGWKLQTTQT